LKHGYYTEAKETRGLEQEQQKRDAEKSKKLITTLLDKEGGPLDVWIKENPIEIIQLDGFPKLKEKVIKRTGIKDLSRLSRNLKTGLI